MKITISGKTPEVDAAVKQIESSDSLGDGMFIASIKRDLLKNNKVVVMTDEAPQTTL